MSRRRHAYHPRIFACLVSLLLVCGMVPGLLGGGTVFAQADELTQREFDNLVEEAQEDDPAFGPEEGELELDQERVAFFTGDIEVGDFLATATFGNPYSGARQQFDYGFQFRGFDDDGEFRALRFVLISDGTWGITDGPNDVIDDGVYRDLDDSRRGENSLTLHAEGDLVHIGINDEYVATVEVPFDDAGEIAVGSGFLEDSFDDGAVTAFSNFTVWDLGTGRRPSSADDEPARGTEYESPTYGYTVTYDDSWTLVDESTRRGVDTLEIDNGLSNLEFIASETTDTPGEAVETVIDSMQSASELTDVTVALDENDEEMRGGDETSAFAVLHVTLDVDGDPFELTVFYQAIWLIEGEAILEITHFTASEDYNEEIENRAAVLETLTIDGQSRDSEDGDATDDAGDEAPADKGDEPSDEESTGQVPDRDPAEEGFSITLEPVTDDGPSAIASLIPEDDQTRVVVVVMPMDPDANWEVTMNSGSCRSPGPRDAELGTPDPSGIIDDLVPRPLFFLMGGIIVIYDIDADEVIACGEVIPDRGP